jgi:predicted TIM-barrel fold metal-dependent hydrolase
VEAVLAAEVAAGNGRFRGIRNVANWDSGDKVHNGHTDPGPELYRDATFRQGFAKLAEFDLSFEAWLYQPQLDDVGDLARAFPDQPIVLNHAGGVLGIGSYAGRRDELFAEWRQQIGEIAACPNVSVKLGGLGMKISGFGFEKGDRPPSSEDLAAAWRPYVETCIEAFGPERCMFESNFPVDKHSCAYPVLWNAFKRLAAGASASEKQELFHDSAARFYRIL